MASQGTIIEGLYELVDEGQVLGDEVRFVGQRLSDKKRVDVRIMGPDASEGARRHFSTVAGLLSRIDHENCLSALGAGQLVDRTLYLVLDIAEAGPAEALIGRRIPDLQVADIGLQLLRGLEHLHMQGIVLGGLSPAGVVVGQGTEGARARIFDFANAHVRGREHGRIRGIEPQWLAPEVLNGPGAVEASDVYSVGRILEAIASSHVSPGLRGLIQRLIEDDPGQRLTAAEASFRFSEVVEEASQNFDLAWLPPPEVTAVSSSTDWDQPQGSSRPEAESTDDIAAPPPAEAAVYVESVGSRSRTPLGIGLLLVGAAAAAALFFALRSDDDPADTPAPVAAAESPAEAGPVAAVSGTPMAAPTQPEKAEGNPIMWLSQVNRTDLGAVLPIAERHRLLDKLASRERVNERVNERWNAMLDLWQASDAERPCATFAAALATLEAPPSTEAETDLLARVVVPSAAPGSRAGIAPDDSCQGLKDAFETYRDSAVPSDTAASPKVARSRRRAKPSAPAVPAAPVVEDAPEAPAAKPEPSAPAPVAKPKSVATKLDDDLRDL